MKKIITTLILTSVIGSANAVSAVRYPRMMPVQNNAYNAYQKGFRDGKRERTDQMVKVAVGAVLIVTSGIILYNVLKPSENCAGQYQIAKF